MSPKVNQKRKLTDYFSTQSMKKIATTASSDLPQARYPPRTQTLGCSIPPPGTDHVQYITLVPGLELWPNFVTSSEQDSILQFLNDPQQCTWRTDLSRRTMHFGGDYCVMPSRTSKADIASDVPYVATKPEIVTAPPIPSQLLWLLDRMSERKIYKQGDQPQYCIVNEYKDNLGISAHTENFSFAEPVVGLSLLSPVSMRFHELSSAFDGSVRSGKAARAPRTSKFVDVMLPSRSLVVMRGPSRWSWQHEILRSKKGREKDFLRVSLTLRLKKAGRRGQQEESDT